MRFLEDFATDIVEHTEVHVDTLQLCAANTVLVVLTLAHLFSSVCELHLFFFQRLVPFRQSHFESEGFAGASSEGICASPSHSHTALSICNIRAQHFETVARQEDSAVGNQRIIASFGEQMLNSRPNGSRRIH